MLQSFDPRNRDLVVNVGGRLVHRDEAGVSPFDSAVQGGDAVWEGLRVYDGRIFKLDEHLARLRRSAEALAFRGHPVGRGDHRPGPAHAGGKQDDRWRARPADAHPWCQDHQRDGPPPQPVRSDPDRRRGAQGAGLRRGRDHPGHVERPPRPGRTRWTRRSTTTTCSRRSLRRSRRTSPAPMTPSCSTTAASSRRPMRPTSSWSPTATCAHRPPGPARKASPAARCSNCARRRRRLRDRRLVAHRPLHR